METGNGLNSKVLSVLWSWEWGYLWILEPMWSWCLSCFVILTFTVQLIGYKNDTGRQKWDYRGIRRKGFIFWNTRYPKYPKILKKFRVWIRYWKKIWVRVGYQVPAGHWSHSDPATTAPKEQKRRTCLNTSVYSAGSKQTIIVVCYYKQSTAVSAGLC